MQKNKFRYLSSTDSDNNSEIIASEAINSHKSGKISLNFSKFKLWIDESKENHWFTYRNRIDSETTVFKACSDSNKSWNFNLETKVKNKFEIYPLESSSILNKANIPNRYNLKINK